MKKIIIGLALLSSISAFAQYSPVERVAKVVAAYTPLSAETILSNEASLNRPILDRYVASEFYGDLSSDLAREFGECSRGALWDREDISILQLGEAVAKRCNL
jgi:hypothetical protein